MTEKYNIMNLIDFLIFLFRNHIYFEVDYEPSTSYNIHLYFKCKAHGYDIPKGFSCLIDEIEWNVNGEKYREALINRILSGVKENFHIEEDLNDSDIV